MSSAISKHKSKQKAKRLEKLVSLFKQMEPTEGVGIVRLLGVRMYEEEIDCEPSELAEKMIADLEAAKKADAIEEFKPVLTPRKTNDIICDFLDKFEALDARKQKMVLDLAREATKKE